MVDQSLVELSLAQRMKGYEAEETKERFEKFKPIYVRLDGRGFSKFTKHMRKPYDEDMSMLMIEVTKHLVKETGAVIGYTQSDEISLTWYADDEHQSVFFDGRKQKMLSNISSICTAKFLFTAMKLWPELCEKRLPTFDARAISMPDFGEVTNMFLWRVQDAYKNSISMAARSMFSSKALENVNGDDRIALMAEKGVNFEDYPDFFKYGTFVRNEKYLAPVESNVVPEAFRMDGASCIRSKIVEVPVGDFRNVKNRVRMVFHKEAPQF